MIIYIYRIPYTLRRYWDHSILHIAYTICATILHAKTLHCYSSQNPSLEKQMLLSTSVSLKNPQITSHRCTKPNGTWCFFCTWLSQGIRRPKKKSTLNHPICSNGIYTCIWLRVFGQGETLFETREMNLLPTLFLLLGKLGQLDGWFRNWLFTYQGGAFLPESLNNMFIQWQVFPSIYPVEISQGEWNHHLEIDYLQNLCLQIARDSGLQYSRFRLVNTCFHSWEPKGILLIEEIWLTSWGGQSISSFTVFFTSQVVQDFLVWTQRKPFPIIVNVLV